MRKAALALSLLFVAACGKNNQPPPPTSGSPFAKPETGPNRGGMAAQPAAPPNVRPNANDSPGLAKAKKMFASVCATCHGMDGTGHGPAAVNLNPPPRNYTDAAWQSTITDDQIKKTILGGGASVGKSPMMPAQPQLKDEPETLDGLVSIVRGFAGSGE